MAHASTERLDSSGVLARHLAALLDAHSALRPVAQQAGPFEIRLTPGGFGGLARVVCGQQLSIASARAIWGRFAPLPGALEAATYLQLDEGMQRAAGLSAAKVRTLRVIAAAIADGTLDLDHAEGLPAAAAVAYLTAHRGIGPWTAEIYLMFCAGHPDIFPSGDLALQRAVGHAFGLAASPSARELAALSAAWSPHRHAAALLFWKYYAAVMRKAGGTAL